MTMAFVVVDGPLAGDFRLLRSIQALGGNTDIVDISSPTRIGIADRLRLSARLAGMVLQGFASSLSRWRLLRATVGEQQAAPFSGMLACLRWLRLVVIGASQLRGRPGFSKGTEFHAHDLYCGVTAVLAGLPLDSKLIYDSHELQIHRNRANGWVRILIDAGLERLILRRADELHVVNAAIAEVMQSLHDMHAKVLVRSNDFYRHHAAPVAPATSLPAMVYVGKGVRGRELELLDQPVSTMGFEVFAYLLGSDLPRHIKGAQWNFGPLDYESSLMQLVSSRRCMMWCCLNTSSLSYRLATPNKFFQALAVGIPIVATRGTYLATLVEKHEIGTVFEEGKLLELADLVLSPVYEKWVERVVAFRLAIRDGREVI